MISSILSPSTSKKESFLFGREELGESSDGDHRCLSIKLEVCER